MTTYDITVRHFTGRRPWSVLPTPAFLRASARGIQRFGSAANLNIHLHCLVLDGVYRRTEGEPDFREARAPTRAELESLLEKIIAPLMKMLIRSGYLVEEQGVSYYLADIDCANPLRSLQAAACTYRIALGARA